MVTFLFAIGGRLYSSWGDVLEHLYFRSAFKSGAGQSCFVFSRSTVLWSFVWRVCWRWFCFGVERLSLSFLGLVFDELQYNFSGYQAQQGTYVVSYIVSINVLQVSMAERVSNWEDMSCKSL